MELDDSPNSLSKLLKYEVVVLFKKNFKSSFTRVLEDIKVSIIDDIE